MEDPRSYAQVGWLSYLSYSWMTPLMKTGARRQVALEDMPKLSSEEDTWSRTRELLHLLHHEERAGRSHPMLRALVRAHWPSLMVMQLLAIFQHCCGLMVPLLMKQVIVFQEAQEAQDKLHKGEQVSEGAAVLSHHQVTAGICAIFASLALGFFIMILNSQVDFFKARLGVRMGQALRGTVLARCVQGELPRMTTSTKSGNTGPAVYNVLSFDVAPLVDIIWIVLGVWLFPIQFITSMLALFHEVQYAIFPGLVTVLLAQAICGTLLFYDGRFRHSLLEAKDKRLNSCSEAFNNIRTLQMMSWTGRFEEQILEARKEELRVKNLRLWMTKMVMALNYVLVALVTLVTLWYFVIHYSAGELKASVALPVLALVGGLIGPFQQFPNWINQYMVWRSAYGRVNEYMGLKRDVESIDGGSGSSGTSPQPASVLEGNRWEISSEERHDTAENTTAIAGFKACTLSWTQPTVTNKKGVSVQPAASSFGKHVDEDGEPILEDYYGDDDDEDDLEFSGAAAPLLADKGNEAVLQDLDFEIRSRELLVIVGKEGQGKSSVLSALLGEMPLVSGAVFSPAIARRVVETKRPLQLPESAITGRELLNEDAAGEGFDGSRTHATCFAPQQAAIYSGTVRWNILFGSRMDGHLYDQVVRACQLDVDIASMPLGDSTELAEGGATLSGGQKARISLARAVYRAVIDASDDTRSGQANTLVLLDDPFSALDRTVAQDIVLALFSRPHGLLDRAAVIVTTADPWWLQYIYQNTGTRAALLREGRLEAVGRIGEIRQMEFQEFEDVRDPSDRGSPKGERNPQDDEGDLCDSESNYDSVAMGKLQSAVSKKQAQGYGKHVYDAIKKPSATKMLFSNSEAAKGKLTEEEHREEGHVKQETYSAYLENVGKYTIGLTLVTLAGIMVFQQAVDLWIVYWSAQNREEHFLTPYVKSAFGKIPEGNHWMLWVYGGLLAFFTLCTFAGHICEIIGGIRAAAVFFKQALIGTLNRPFRWWDTTPTGRVLNRFSEDVEVMDNSITNILGVIFGAVLYFIGHVSFLALANKWSLLLLPVIIVLLECIARYYRRTIREVHRLYLVSVSSVYQGMVEAITSGTTVRAYAASQRVVCQSLLGLDDYIRIAFTKSVINSWVGLRMGLVGYALSVATTLYPVFQYFGVVAPRAAGLIAFSITYSSGISGIIQQFIMNFSDLEMQLVSIERLREYSVQMDQGKCRGSPLPRTPRTGDNRPKPNVCLELRNVSVTYRDGLKPALQCISLAFTAGKSCAIVGRTGAGKSSLLLSILQLVPYSGYISIDGQLLGQMDPHEVRKTMVGVVPQHPVIFDGTLRWNLDPDGSVSSMEIWCALEAVGLLKVIRELEDERGLDIPMGVPGGLLLSQGQKQLLCAARTLLREPRVALLDEISASLPANSAKQTTSALLTRFKENEAAVLLVTHQTEIAAACDRTVTISSGRVIGDGLQVERSA